MSERVLLVDDDPMLLSSTQRYLGLRFDLDTAESGAAALQLIAEQGPYGVIITDMRMPRMDGIAFIHQARPLCEATEFVMLSGNQDAATRERAFSEGNVARFLNKPCDPDEIAETIEWGLARRAPELSGNTL